MKHDAEKLDYTLLPFVSISRHYCVMFLLMQDTRLKKMKIINEEIDYDYEDQFIGFSKNGEDKFKIVKVEYLTIEYELDEEETIDDVILEFSRDYEYYDHNDTELTLTRIV